MLSFCYGVGWKMNLLSSAVPYGEGEAVAYEVEVSRPALQRMRQMWGLPQPAYVEINKLEGAERNVHEAAERLMRKDPLLRELKPSPELAVGAGLSGGGAMSGGYYTPHAVGGSAATTVIPFMAGKDQPNGAKRTANSKR
jgi:hypothetical protein